MDDRCDFDRGGDFPESMKYVQFLQDEKRLSLQMYKPLFLGINDATMGEWLLGFCVMPSHPINKIQELHPYSLNKQLNLAKQNRINTENGNH